MNYFQYLFEHIEQLAKLAGYIAVPFLVFTGLLKRIYFNHRSRSPKKVLKLITYLKQCDKYIDKNDIEHIKMRINDEIMRDITKIPSAYNRKDLIYIFNEIEKKQYINQLYKLQSYIEKEDNHFCIKLKYIDGNWIVNRLMAFVLGLLFLFFIILDLFSIIENKGDFTYIGFLLISVVLESAGLWIFSAFPTRRIIENINIELAKIKVPD